VGGIAAQLPLDREDAFSSSSGEVEKSRNRQAGGEPARLTTHVRQRAAYRRAGHGNQIVERAVYPCRPVISPATPEPFFEVENLGRGAQQRAEAEVVEFPAMDFRPDSVQEEAGFELLVRGKDARRPRRVGLRSRRAG